MRPCLIDGMNAGFLRCTTTIVFDVAVVGGN